MLCKLLGFTAISISATLAIAPVKANTSLYDSQGAARRACERWAEKGETIFVSSHTHIQNPTTYETDSKYTEGEHAGKIVYVYMQPILLRSCNFDYNTTSYIGYQHKGTFPAPEWWPKRVDGSDWAYEGKVLRIFRGWTNKRADSVKVNSYPF